MKKVSIYQARTHLSRLVERAAGGEEIVIAKAGKAVARLAPFTAKMEPRRPGYLRGKIRIKKSFDRQLPIKELESRHREGYKRKPVKRGEFSDWEPE